MRIFIAIIVVLLFIILSASSTLLNGNWVSTEDFTNKSGAQIFLNLSGHLNRSAKLIIISATEGVDPVIVEGNMFFIGSPHNFLLFKNRGVIKTSGFENILPKILYYKFDISGKLMLYADKLYACLTKVCDL